MLFNTVLTFAMLVVWNLGVPSVLTPAVCMKLCRIRDLLYELSAFSELTGYVVTGKNYQCLITEVSLQSPQSSTLQPSALCYDVSY